MAQKYLPLKDHDTPIKVLFTGYLCAVGIGYFFALLQILFTHGMADGKFGLSVDDIVYSYYGNRSGTVLETQLNGAMKENATEDQRFKMIQWVRDGADAKEYKSGGIEAIVQERCVMCHNEQATTIPDFNKFDNLKALTKEDTGATFGSLTRVSHVHLFGISFIFMFVGLIFSFSEATSTKYKCIAIGMPYVFLVADILSWWLTKIDPMFAWLIILAGMGMGISFMFMWVNSLLEMWAYQQIYVEGGGIYGQKLRAFWAAVYTPARREWVIATYKLALQKGREIWLNTLLPKIKELLDRVSKSNKPAE